MTISMRLVGRDLQIFECLAKFHFLTARQLALLFSMDIKRMNRRLKKLSDSGYVDHIQRFTSAVHGKGEYVYYISDRAVRDLENFIPDNYFRSYLESDRRLPLLALEHTLKTNDFLAIATVAVNKTAGKYGLHFIPELLKHKVGNRYVSYIRDAVTFPDGMKYEFSPDAVICLENSAKKKLLFFVEVDRGGEIISSNSGNYDISRKIATYGQYFDSRGYERYADEFGYFFSGFRVLLCTSSAVRMKNILESCARQGDSSFLWLTTFNDLKVERFLRSIWRNCADDKLQSLVSGASL